MRSTGVIKEGCTFLMVAVPMLTHAEFGRNDHRECALHFKTSVFDKNVHVPFECHVQVNSIFIGGLQVKLVQVYCIYLNFVLQR